MTLTKIYFAIYMHFNNPLQKQDLITWWKPILILTSPFLFSYDVSKYYKFSFWVSTCKRKVTNILLIYEQEVLIKDIEVDKIVFLVDITNGKNHFFNVYWISIQGCSVEDWDTVLKHSIMSLLGHSPMSGKKIQNDIGYIHLIYLVERNTCYEN